jgi:hypothetical protein
MQSLLFYVPVVCDISSILEDIPKNAQAALQDVLKSL